MPSRHRALLLALGAFVVLGLTDGATGTVWPDLRDAFGRSDGSFGLLFIAGAGGYLVASASSGHLADRYGFGRIIRAGITVAAVSFVSVALAVSWWGVVLGWLGLGIGNGLLDASTNAWVAVTRGPRAMGLLHGFYGVGAAAGPLVAVAFVAGDRSLWAGPFLVFAGLQAAALAVFPFVRDDFDRRPEDGTTDTHASSAADTGGNTLLRLVLLWFFFYVGAEVAVGQWSFTLLTEGRGMSDAVGGWFVSIYWGGLTVGRFAMAAYGNRMNPERLMTQASVVAVGATVLLAVDPGGAGGLGLPLLGAAFSVMFPVVVNRTPIYLGADRAARVVGYQLATSSAGAIVIPTLVGLVADRTSTEVLGVVAVVSVGAAAATWAAVRSLVTARS